MPRHGYRTLDLVKASAFGWTQYRDLSGPDYQVLQFVALRGKADEPGVAYAWFPLGGQAWWADLLMLPYPTLRKALSRLRNKDLLVNLPGSSKDSRFLAIKGYGIPASVMEECRNWHIERRNLVFYKTQDVRMDVPHSHTNVTERNIDVTERNIDVTERNMGSALTWGFPAHTQEETQEENPGETQILTESSPTANSHHAMEDSMIRYEDEWSAGDPADDFSVPKDALRKAPGQSTPANRIATIFYDEWKIARERRPMLATPWSVKMIFLKNLKDLLKDRSEEFVGQMVLTFFRLVENGQVGLKSNELWKDFWFNRALVERLVLQRTSGSGGEDAESELERYRKRVGR